jgi:nitrile hydratase accessory protein
LTPPEHDATSLRQRDGQPPFEEPWHAQTLALADLLVKSGEISAAHWAEALGAEIAAAKARGEPDEAAAYFGAALSALGNLLAESGRVTPAELAERQNDWEHAHLHTPHGSPVELGDSHRHEA